MGAGVGNVGAGVGSVGVGVGNLGPVFVSVGAAKQLCKTYDKSFVAVTPVQSLVIYGTC